IAGNQRSSAYNGSASGNRSRPGPWTNPQADPTHEEIAVRKLAILASFAVVFIPALRAEEGAKKVPPVLNFKMKSLDGKDVELSKYQGKVVLFVNTASKCGLTPQYE